MIILKKFNIAICPEEEASRDWPTIINVSDTPGPKLGQAGYYWYPINEISNWGYGPFYWSKKILDKHIGQSDKILVHCHAGAHRSPMIVYWWLRSCGHPTKTIEKWFDYPISKLAEQDMRKNHIPSDLMEFYKEIRKNPTWSLMGILNSMGKGFQH